MGRLRVAAISAAAIAGVLWVISVTAIWVPVDGQALANVRAMAATLSVLAALGWLAGGLRDRAVLYLVDRAAASRRAAQTEEEAPLRAARAR